MKHSVLKTALALIALIALLAVLVWAVFAFAPLQFAYADSAVEAIKAPVSNLEGNATAGRSTLALLTDDSGDEFYIPESYFVINPIPTRFDGVYNVQYAGHSFLMEGSISNKTTTVFGDEELSSPDITLSLLDGKVVEFEKVRITDAFTIKLLGYNADGTQIYAMATEGARTLFGFIPLTDLQPFSIPYQAKTQAEREAILAQKDAPKLENGDIAPNTSLALRIIIILGIAIPSVLIVVLLFKPSKNERSYRKNAVRTAGDRGNEYDSSRNFVRNDSMERPVYPQGGPGRPYDQNGYYGDPNDYNDR